MQLSDERHRYLGDGSHVVEPGHRLGSDTILRIMLTQDHMDAQPQFTSRVTPSHDDGMV